MRNSPAPRARIANKDSLNYPSLEDTSEVFLTDSCFPIHSIHFPRHIIYFLLDIVLEFDDEAPKGEKMITEIK